MTDEFYMRQALAEGRRAMERGEVPVGAVVVANGRIIARAHNLTETLHDVTAHAEMQAFTAAANSLDSKYLNDCTLYVTLEPCVMCAGAAYWTRIGRIVYGAPDPKRGFMLTGKQLVHPKTEIIGGVLHEECTAVLKEFFEKKR
ncbi:MAG: tRNA-specific adenosine deaminase [Bacteroidetes bacterium GWF2_49_14]|nr:MAG: tRNA-specific adenosine deaminase [Bacteroidetes bacterium GWF2_49_14]